MSAPLPKVQHVLIVSALQAINMNGVKYLVTSPKTFVVDTGRECEGVDASVCDATQYNLVAPTVPCLVSGTAYVHDPTALIIDFMCGRKRCQCTDYEPGCAFIVCALALLAATREVNDEGSEIMYICCA